MIYPVAERSAVLLPAASSANVLTEPSTTAIGEDEYTKGVGFGGLIFDVLITFLEDAGAGEGITIETSGTQDFAVVTVPTLRTDPPHYGGLLSGAGFLEGQQIAVRGLEGSGRWRVRNQMAGSISVSYQVRPNR